MINCTKCYGPSACYECDGSSDTTYLKADKTGCVKECPEYISATTLSVKECYTNECPSG